MNPWCRPCTQGNRSEVVFRHDAQFLVDVTRVLRGGFRGGFVYVSFRFKAKESPQRRGDVFFYILMTSTGACLSLSFDTFRNFNRS